MTDGGEYSDRLPVVVLIIRPHREGVDLAARLSEQSGISLLVVHETGSDARVRRVERAWSVGRLHAMKFLLLDAPVLALYRRVTRPSLIRRAAPRPVLRVADVNQDKLSALIAALEPSLILNYGTSIYSRETLERVGSAIINIHDGILPTFRNVHTDFWAFFCEARLPFGVTLFEIDERIDAGTVVRQEAIDLSGVKNFREARSGLAGLRASLAMSLIVEKLNGVACITDETMRQASVRSAPNLPLWDTPTAGDIWKAVSCRPLSPRFVASRKA